MARLLYKSLQLMKKRANDYQTRPDFIQQYIFPGGMLTTKQQLNNAKEVGLKCIELLSFANHMQKISKYLEFSIPKFLNI